MEKFNKHETGFTQAGRKEEILSKHYFLKRVAETTQAGNTLLNKQKFRSLSY
jgi:hypothetical protein